MRVLLFLALLVTAPPAMAQQMAPGTIQLAVEIEDRAHTPHVGEMVLVTIRGSYRAPITLESLKQPPLDGFNWMQLGEDRWFNTAEQGQTVVNLERRMALFPQASGTLEIGAFAHNLVLLSPDGRRFEHVETSAPRTLNVDPAPQNAAWWFPVRGIEVSDNWSNPPERLAEGGAALRLVVLTAHGVEPELLPPMPEMTGAGAYLFPHPEKRIVTLGPSGPITRAFWRWTVRPKEETAGFINPLTIHYFDVHSREHQEITLTAQRVAYEGQALGVASQDGTGAEITTEPTVETREHPLPTPPPGWAAPVGLALGLAVLWLNRRRAKFDFAARVTRWRQDRAQRSALRQAARNNDPAKVWHQIQSLPTKAGIATKEDLAPLEAHLFAPLRPPCPDLAKLVEGLLRRQ